MTTDKKTHKKPNGVNPLYLIYGLVGVILVLTLVLVGYGYVFANKSLLNTYLQKTNISSKSPDQIKSAIDQIDSNYPDKKIKVVYKDKNWEISYKDISWSLDKNKTETDIIGYGHQGSYYQRGIELLHSLVAKKQFSLEYSFDENAFLNWMNGIDQEIGTAKVETNIIVKDGQAKITDSKAGVRIDDDALRQKVLDRLELKDKGDIQIELITDNPVITHQEAEGLVDSAKTLTNHSVKLVGPNGSTDLDSNTLGASIALKKKKVRKGVLKSELGPAYVSFDSDEIKNILQKQLDSLNKPAVDAQFSISNGNISLTSASQTGEVINLDESVSTIISALELGKTEIKLPSKIQAPSIDAQGANDISKIGIKEIIGSATTDFKKSPDNRVHNIQTGVKYISGAVIKPGEEFSTIGRLGTIDQNSGYLPELVIKENATVPEFGGGLCQVSTTLFRAAMNAGLKISERQNHSYRVSYYEPPVGMDATIYYPKPDFKFVNTTDNYILINGHIEGTKITFDIYGTKDGRVASVTDPVVYDVTQPPDSIYTDDPTLAPGEVKQIDHAHPGAKATFDYTVKKDGKVINQQTFNSYYVAWPAKFLRGPQVDNQAQSNSDTSTSTPTPSATSTQNSSSPPAPQTP